MMMFRTDFKNYLQSYKMLNDFFKKNFHDEWLGNVKSFFIENGEVFINYDGSYDPVPLPKVSLMKALDNDITF